MLIGCSNKRFPISFTGGAAAAAAAATATAVAAAAAEVGSAVEPNRVTFNIKTAD